MNDATAERLAGIHAAAFPAPWDATALAGLLTQAGVFAVEQPDGFILLRTVADEAEILTLAVHPKARRRGLGARLVREGVAGAAAQGATRLFLEVADDNAAALALYARAGVPEYWIVDPPAQLGEAPQLQGFLLDNGAYRAAAPAADGRLESRACRVWFKAAADDVQVGDLRTGKPLPPPVEDDDPTLAAQAEASRRAQSIAGQLNLGGE